MRSKAYSVLLLAAVLPCMSSPVSAENGDSVQISVTGSELWSDRSDPAEKRADGDRELESFMAGTWTGSEKKGKSVPDHETARALIRHLREGR